MVDGRSGFLFLNKDCLPEVAMHWEHWFNHMVKRYNDIYRVQMPNITPHVCRHTYCSNQAKAGMNPKTLQYLMGHSDIGVTLNTYTHLGLEDAAEELRRMEEAEAARREQEKLAGKAKDAQKLFNASENSDKTSKALCRSRVPFSACARHGRQLGGESPLRTR